MSNVAGQPGNVRAAAALINDLLKAVRAKCATFVPGPSEAIKAGTDMGVKLGKTVTQQVMKLYCFTALLLYCFTVKQ